MSEKEQEQFYEEYTEWSEWLDSLLDYPLIGIAEEIKYSDDCPFE